MTDDQSTETTAEGRRSPFLAVLGVLALLVAGWGLADGPDISSTSAVPWTILVIGVVIGVGLVASGIHRR
ncbi:hypothetical protein [Gordonia humi]|uniref:Uncharacterized protein n=1 Tax=Gordonia humi TaxID=686429 RepID=A0A840F5X1_9ACTN|nr:hypothetical protein [Gordonia humi]MBB4135630.1 hypothetical protein [Gordonia humi]